MRNLLTYSLFENRSEEASVDIEDIDHILSYLNDFKDISFERLVNLRKLPFVNSHVEDIEVYIFKDDGLIDMDLDIIDTLNRLKTLFKKRYDIKVSVIRSKRYSAKDPSFTSKFPILCTDSDKDLKNILSIKIDMIKK